MSRKRSGQGALERLTGRIHAQNVKDAKARQAAGYEGKQPNVKDARERALRIAKKHDHKRG